jgi:hypothetical protein
MVFTLLGVVTILLVIVAKAYLAALAIIAATVLGIMWTFRPPPRSILYAVTDIRVLKRNMIHFRFLADRMNQIRIHQLDDNHCEKTAAGEHNRQMTRLRSLHGCFHVSHMKDTQLQRDTCMMVELLVVSP